MKSLSYKALQGNRECACKEKSYGCVLMLLWRCIHLGMLCLGLAALDCRSPSYSLMQDSDCSPVTYISAINPQSSIYCLAIHEILQFSWQAELLILSVSLPPDSPTLKASASLQCKAGLSCRRSCKLNIMLMLSTAISFSWWSHAY